MSDYHVTANQEALFFIKNFSFESKYRYEILTEKYIEQVADLFTRAFCRSEPMTQYLHLDETKYRVFARAVTVRATEDQLSIIALDGERVIAIALVEDLAIPGDIPDFDPQFIYILTLLEKLGEDFFPDKVLETGNIAHLFITAVDDEYRHQGLSKQVNFRAMELAARNHFDYVYCELTNYYNELGILHHLNSDYELIGSVFYQDFICQNIKPFSHLSGGANSYLWNIRQNPKLRYQIKSHI